MIEAMRRSFVERAGDGSAPEQWERAAVHVLYLGSAVFCLRGVSGLAGIGRSLGVDAAGQLIVILAVCGLFTFWAAFRRRRPCEGWFASHLLWLTTTYAVLGGAFAAVLVVIAVIVILMLLVPFLTFLLYLPLGVSWALTGWFGWRLLRGYPAFLQRNPIGTFERA